MAIPRQRIHLPPRAWRSALGGAVRGALWEGDDIARFERDFASMIGAVDAVAVASGRAGLRAILETLEPGCEVICSSFGYPVVPHLVKSMGFELRLADCEMQTLGMDPDALAKIITPRTGAVIVTHLYGVPARIEAIEALARANDAVLIEDCAHCCGASVGDRQTGTFGRLAYFSFETSKMINTLGGGMITTDDEAIGARLREAQRAAEPRTMKWLGQRLLKTSFEATVTGPLAFNTAVYPALRITSRDDGGDDRFASGYHGDHVTMRGRTGRYTNYQARLGLAQMGTYAARLERRVANAQRLIEQLEPAVTFQRPDPGATANYMLVTALFEKRQTVGDRLLKLGIDTKHHYMRDCSGLVDDTESFPCAKQAEAEVLHLPAFPELSAGQIDRVARAVRSVVGGLEEGGALQTVAGSH